MNYIENIIIGAGPSGLQLGYYFEKNNTDYLIIEKSDSCGSFFKKYPHSKNLISINKVNTGSSNEDFNLRHDWNSLLNDEQFLFKQYSKKFYPNSMDLYTYLNDFQKKFSIKISFNNTVLRVNKKDKLYHIKLDSGQEYKCKNLIIASGFSKIKKDDIEIKSKKEILHYGEYSNDYFQNEKNLQSFVNKKTLIIGNGNSAYELGNLLNDYCYSILLLGRPKNYSFVSHYSGDIRSVYYPFFDTFYLKSLNAIDTVCNNKICIDDYNDKFILKQQYGNENYYSNEKSCIFDKVILCTGWKFDMSIFKFDIKLLPNEFPALNSSYESINNNNLYVIGALMHGADKNVSSGGFIHGFRYLIQFFHNAIYTKTFDKTTIQFKGDLSCYKELTTIIHNRINTSSSLYQMFNVMCDVFYFDNNLKQIVYIKDLTLSYVKSHLNHIEKLNVLVLKYGEKNYDIRKIGSFNKDHPMFIHPEIFIINNRKTNFIEDKIVIDEDLFADFSSEEYFDKIYRSIMSCHLIF